MNIVQSVQQTFNYLPPTQQAYQYKIFINQCNEYIGSSLVEQFRNDHLIESNPNIIVGSITKQQFGQQINVSGVSMIVDINNQRLFNSVVFQADIILFSLNQHNIQQFQYLLKLLRNATLQKQKRLICIGSFLSWGRRRNTAFPIKVSTDGLHSRNSTDYHIKALQNLCLSLHNQNNKVKGSVIFSGLVYGNGQDQLFSYFKRALQQEKPLQIYGKGSNSLPMIHVTDLCRIANKVAFKQFDNKKNWHFACDQSTLTQKDIISAIASNLGNGAVAENFIQDCFIKQNYEQMTLDLQIHDKQYLDQWHSKEGIICNISSIVSEFNEYRGLKPNKVLILGAPLSGKSSIAFTLQKNYGLPIISIKSLISDIKSDSSPFGLQITTLLQQIRVAKVDQQRKVYEEIKKKKKGKGVEDFDESKIVGRLPDTQVAKVLKWRLQKDDCRNKGYILDSVVKTWSVAQAVFQTEGQLNQVILPNSVFFIKATDQQIKQRLKSLPADKTQNTHWTQQQTLRRLQSYLKQNQQKSVRSYFETKCDLKQVQLNYPGAQIFTEFIQRNGPLGFKKQVQAVAQLNQPAESNQVQANQQQNDQQQNQNDQEHQVEEQFNLDKLTVRQQKILNQKSRPIRQYLIDNVIPDITEGLLEICKEIPEDPIQFLIQFLENKNIKNN